VGSLGQHVVHGHGVDLDVDLPDLPKEDVDDDTPEEEDEVV
jgi:hypothetical protein